MIPCRGLYIIPLRIRFARVSESAVFFTPQQFCHIADAAFITSQFCHGTHEFLFAFREPVIAHAEKVVVQVLGN